MFRFTIRDVLWLTVVVAMAVGWASVNWTNQLLAFSAIFRGPSAPFSRNSPVREGGSAESRSAVFNFAKLIFP